MDLSSDPVKYIIPNRWCDAENSVSINETSIKTIEKYLSGDESTVKNTKLKKMIQELIDRHEMPEEIFKELLRYEFGKDSYSIRHNSILEYLVEQSTPDLSDQAICDYLNDVVQRESNYLELDLPELVRWKMHQQETSYEKSTLN